jgi:AbrB family looped-hinge helix DNA binding protein
MSKVTSKLQVPLPKTIADRYGIQPGDEIEWSAAGDAIRIVPGGRATPPPDPLERLRHFDLATSRLRRRASKSPKAETKDRGWKREDLYERGRSH